MATDVWGTFMTRSGHILVVDDEAEVRDLLKEYLAKQGFVVSTADSVPAARSTLRERAVDLPVDLIVLDLRMPGEDGLSFARELQGQSNMAIIMLTASSEIIDRVVGLEIGADDYVAKPFDPRELLARIRSVLRRQARHDSDRDVSSRPPSEVKSRTIPFGRCLLNLEARQLLAPDGSDVPITAMQFDLIEAFISNPRRVLTRERLLDLAHRRGNDPFDRSIDIRVARLRQKIEKNPDKPQTIRTVHGTGYIFVPENGTPETG